VVLLALPPWYQDADEPKQQRLARLTPVAVEVAAAAHSLKYTEADIIAAALLTLGWHESRWARYVGEGRCLDGPPGARCDPYRGVPQARTYWQVHRNACPAAWRQRPGSAAELQAAARCAAVHWQGAYGRCKRRAVHGPVAGAFSGYRGADCNWRGGVARARSFQSFRLQLSRALARSLHRGPSPAAQGAERSGLAVHRRRIRWSASPPYFGAVFRHGGRIPDATRTSGPLSWAQNSTPARQLTLLLEREGKVLPTLLEMCRW
jgi:hypothetical protein